MSPEEKARFVIDEKLIQSGWIIQDVKQLDLSAGLGIAVREFPTSTGRMDYALFVDGAPVGVVEAKRSDYGENITAVEGQTARYAKAHSNAMWRIMKFDLHMKQPTSWFGLRIIMILNTAPEQFFLSTGRKLCRHFWICRIPYATI